MTLTLSNCIERINQALDYPALEYADISHYFDQAIAELNSTLRIGIKPVTQLLAENAFELGKLANLVALDKEPTSLTEDYIPVSIEKADESSKPYYYDTITSKYGIKKNGTWSYHSELYGFVNDPGLESQVYTSSWISDAIVMWVPYDTSPLHRLDLTDYLPSDIVILFMIPYICYKYTIRDGGEGAIFREEFMEGFQQIQTSYDIPNTVSLVKMAGKKAYATDVQENIKNLNVTVPTRAIYDTMKIGNAIMPTYGGFYEDGGWGI